MCKVELAILVTLKASKSLERQPLTDYHLLLDTHSSE